MNKTTRKSNRSNRKIVFVAVGLIIIYIISNIFISVLNFTKEPEITLSLSKYSSIDEYFEIRYPDNWVLFQTPHGNHGDMEVIAIAGPANDFSLGMTIAKRSATSNSDVDTWALDRIKREDTQRIGTTTPYISSFLSGETRDYLYNTQTPLALYSTKCKDYYFITDHHQYIFSFCVDEKKWDVYTSVFESVIASARPLNKD